MKLLKLLIVGMIFILSIANTFAIPEISYTNFARTAGGGLVLNSTVNVRITIFNGGVQVYQEIHSGVPTNEFGLFTVKLGQGTPVGPDTYDGLVANTNLNVRSESDDGGGYRFIQLSALLNTALKNEEAAGAVTLNDAYTNGQDIDVLAGFPVYLKGTGLIQSDATIAAINANGNKTLTTKQYVDAAIAAIFPLPPLTEGAGLEILPGHQYDGTSTQSVGIKDLGVTTAKIADAAVTTVKILDDAVTEPKLKMANSPVTGYIIKWNGTDMTWSDPTVFTSHPVVGTGTALDPITLYTTGVNNDDVLYYNGSQWTNGKVTSGMILDGTINNNDINNSTIFVQVTGESGTPFNVTNGNRILDFQGVGNTTVSLDNTTHTVYIEAGIVADIPLSGAGTALDHLILNYDATLDLNGTALSINTGNSNTWTANQFLPATNAQGNNLVAAINVADPNSLNADVLKYDNTLQVVANQLGFNHEHYNTWLSTQTFNPNTNEPAILANSSGFFNRNINTETAFALQGWAVGQTSSLLDFPTVAQGVTGVGEYSGATPSTNFAIGTVGLGIAGNGVIAIGTYGGARENNPVANVGTVGHAYNDNIGMADMNHGVLGLVSLTQDGSVEVATALSLDVNSGVTGINLGTNANDWAGYFIGKVNVTNNLMVGNNASVNNNFNVNGNTTLGDAASDVLTVNAQIGSDLIPNTDNIYNLGSSTLRWKDLYLSNNAWVGNDLSVTNDATVGGDLTVAGTTTSGLFVGQLDKEITNGDGIATFVFDNTADAVVEFDYAFYNEWTVTQTITVSGDEPALVLDGTNATSGFTLLAVGDGVSGNTDFYFDGTVDITEDLTVGNDLTVTNNATTNTLNVTTTAVVGTDLTVNGNTTLGDNAASDLVTFNSTVNSNFIPTTTNTYDLGSNTLRWKDLYLSNNAWVGNDLSVTNDATVGGDLTVTGTTTSGLFVGQLDKEITNGDGIATFVFDNTADAVVEFDYAFYNQWTVTQTVAVSGDEPALVLDGTNAATNPTLVAVGNGTAGDVDFLFDGSTYVSEDLTVDGNTVLGDNAASDLVTFNSTVNSNFIPTTTNNYNLGSNTLRWGNLYLSNNAWVGNDLSVTNDATVGNNLTVTNNTTTGSLNVNTTAVVGTDLTVNGNTTLGDAASDVLTVNAQIRSNLIPNTDNIYNLGSSILRWNDLFLGPGTLHIGTNGDEGTMSYNITLDRFEFNQDVYVGGTVEATTFDGNFTDGSVLFANANGEIAENNSQLFWDNTYGYLGLNSNTPTAVIDIYPNNPGDVLLLANGVDDGSPDVAIAGEVLIIPESGLADGNPELWVNGGDGVLIDGGATLSIGDVTPYTFPNQGGAADQFLMYNGTSDLEWYGFDNSLTVDNINKTVGFNPNFPFVFNTLIAFNPSTGPAIEATSSDASEPTVTIENTNPLGVALELVGAQPQTTALEITTGGINLANGQMIVSSNAGVTGGGANGPSITINNNGDGLGENGGAIQVVLGHTAFSYNNYSPAYNASVDLSQEAYTVYDIVSNGSNSVTLPTSDVAADIPGTIIYILNNGLGTLNLPGSLGIVSVGNAAILVYTSSGWFRIQ